MNNKNHKNNQCVFILIVNLIYIFNSCMLSVSLIIYVLFVFTFTSDKRTLPNKKNNSCSSIGFFHVYIPKLIKFVILL